MLRLFDMIKLSSIIVPVATVMLLIGCGGGSKSSDTAKTRATTRSKSWWQRGELSPPADTRHIVVRALPRLGIVMVDGRGHSLYAFVADEKGATCVGGCAATWPPFILKRGDVLDTSPALSEERITTEPKERYREGVRVVRYAGWLLHSYIGDSLPGVAKGQGLHADGGHWYLLAPSGKLIKAKP